MWSFSKVGNFYYVEGVYDKNVLEYCQELIDTIRKGLALPVKKNQNTLINTDRQNWFQDQSPPDVFAKSTGVIKLFWFRNHCIILYPLEGEGGAHWTLMWHLACRGLYHCLMPDYAWRCWTSTLIMVPINFWQNSDPFKKKEHFSSSKTNRVKAFFVNLSNCQK